jgi:hypothetical protein
MRASVSLLLREWAQASEAGNAPPPSWLDVAFLLIVLDKARAPNSPEAVGNA